MEKLPAMDSAKLSKCLEITSEKLIEAKKGAKRLLGCYRTGDANDPETYTAAITAILAEYEPEVVRHVTDPRTGLARKNNWLPTVAEVDAACLKHAKFLSNLKHLEAKGWRYLDGKLIPPTAA